MWLGSSTCTDFGPHTGVACLKVQQDGELVTTGTVDSLEDVACQEVALLVPGGENPDALLEELMEGLEESEGENLDSEQSEF